MFIRNVFYTFSTQIFTVVANFLVGVVLARSLSPADRGIMVLMMTLPWTVVSLVSLGLPQANIYMIGRRHHAPRSVLGNSLVMAVILGLLSVAVLHLARPWLLQTVLKDVPSRLWVVLILLAPTILVDVMTTSILCARQRFDLFNLRRVALPILLLVGFVAGLVILRCGLTAAAWVYLGAAVSMACLSLVLVNREVPLVASFDPDLAQKSLRFGFKSYLHDLVGNLNYRVDMYILAFFLTPTQIAFYGVATSIAEIAWYIPNSVGTVLFPRLTHAPEQEVHQITARVCRNTLALTGIVVAGLSALGWYFVPLVYGEPYRETVPPLLILLPGVLAMVIYKVLARDFNSRNKQQVPILTAAIALTLNAGLDLLLIQRWGVVGAAVASTVGYTAAGVVLLIFFVRESGLAWKDAVIPRLDEMVGHLNWARGGFQDIVTRDRAGERIKE
jgi:O-antigen/teichoic acid export membrane protein